MLAAMRIAGALLVTMVGALVWPALAPAELIGTCGEDLCAVSETGKVSRLTRDGATRSYSTPSVSRDGSVLAFVAGGDLYRGGRRGAKAALLFDAEAGDARELDLSPDGKSFIFRTAGTSFTGGSIQFESVLRIGGAIGSRLYSSTSEVSVGGFLTSTVPLFTSVPPGRSSNNQAVCRLALLTSNETPPCGQRVADDAATNMSEPVGSPDGKLVAVANEVLNANFNVLSSRISLFDASTARRVRDLTTGPDDSAPSFSPDGKLVAFSRGADTWVVPTAGGAPRKLGPGVVQASWGGPVALASRPSRRISVRGRRARIKVRCPNAGGCAAARWRVKAGRATLLRIKVPALPPRGSRTISSKLTARGAARVRRAGRRGVTGTLTGAGPRPIRVKLR